MAYLKLMRAHVGHRRLWPKTNSFRYRVFYISTPITKESFKTPVLFSYNRFNVFSLYKKDYGKRSGDAKLYDFIAKEVSAIGIDLDSDKYDVVLISHPRLFGYAFNPISYWVVTNKNKEVIAVLCEVHNTFGDTHNYLLSKPQLQPILAEDVLLADKKLYVSPYNTMEGHYEFQFIYTGEYFKSSIRYFDSERQILDTYMSGTLGNLSSWNILSSVALYPFMTLLVVFRIHYQAVRLYLKKVKHTLKIRPHKYKSNETTRSQKLK